MAKDPAATAQSPIAGSPARTVGGGGRRGNMPDRPASRDLGQLRHLARFLWPYRLQLAAAVASLTVAAGTVLALGSGLKALIDQGFGAGDGSLLDRAVIVLFGVTAVLALATFARFYLVSWIGERVIADIRRAV